jgi:hypothetical protein
VLFKIIIGGDICKFVFMKFGSSIEHPFSHFLVNFMFKILD